MPNSLIEASQDGNINTVRRLLERGADVHAENDAALRGAVRWGHVEVVRALLAAGADAHANDDEALGDAAEWGRVEILDLLLAIGGMDARAINAALMQTRVAEVVRILLEAGADAHDEALIRASSNGNDEVVQVLLEAGANVHARDDEALLRASRIGYAKVVQLLLDAGANVHARNEAALLGASEIGNINVVRALLAAGADVHARNGAALKTALRFRHAEIVRLLRNADKPPIRSLEADCGGDGGADLKTLREVIEFFFPGTTSKFPSKKAACAFLEGKRRELLTLIRTFYTEADITNDCFNLEDPVTGIPLKDIPAAWISKTGGGAAGGKKKHCSFKFGLAKFLRDKGCFAGTARTRDCTDFFRNEISDVELVEIAKTDFFKETVDYLLTEDEKKKIADEDPVMSEILSLLANK